MRQLQWIVPGVVSGILAAGCGTYMEAKSNIAPGGQLNRDIVSAKTDLALAKRQGDDLRDLKLQRDREIERTEKRIQAEQVELAKYDADLSEAYRQQRLSKARHGELKSQLSSLQAEISALNLQNASDRIQDDPKARADKEARLAALEQRRRELQSAMSILLRR